MNNDPQGGVLTADSCCDRGCFTPLCRKITWIIIVVILVTLGLFAALGEHIVATLAMQSQLVLTNWRSHLFKTWQDEANFDIEVLRHYYFYNVTNPREVYFDRVKPDLNMVGPFTFQTRRSRPLPYMSWDAENNVNFRYHDYQHFRPDLSVDSTTGRRLDANTELITTVNMALFTAAYRVSKIPEFREKLVNGSYIVKQDICLLLDMERLLAKDRALGPKGIFTQRTAMEWLFGFKDDTLEMLNAGSAIIDYYVPTKFHLQFNDTVPAPGPISYRHGQMCPLADDESLCNTSLLSDSAVLSGRRWNEVGSSNGWNLETVGIMRKWADNDRFWWFGGGGERSADEGHTGGNDADGTPHPADDSDCQQIGGTEGLFVGAFIDKKSKPSIFIDSMFRTVDLSYLEETSYQGIDALRFGPAAHETDLNSRNRRCFHQYYKGSMINFSHTVFAPGWVTGKFFYPMDGDTPLVGPAFTDKNMHIFPNGTKAPLRALNFTLRWPPNSNNKVEMRDIVNGPNQTQEAMGSHLDIHPLTGSTLNAVSRIQVNSQLGPIMMEGCALSFSDMLPQTRLTPEGKEYTSYFPETGLPVLLVERVGGAPAGVVDFLKSSVIAPLLALRVLGWALFGLGMLAAAILSVYYCYFRPAELRRREATKGYAPHTSYLDDDRGAVPNASMGRKDTAAASSDDHLGQPVTSSGALRTQEL